MKICIEKSEEKRTAPDQEVPASELRPAIEDGLDKELGIIILPEMP